MTHSILVIFGTNDTVSLMRICHRSGTSDPYVRVIQVNNIKISHHPPIVSLAIIITQSIGLT